MRVLALRRNDQEKAPPVLVGRSKLPEGIRKFHDFCQTRERIDRPYLEPEGVDAKAQLNSLTKLPIAHPIRLHPDCDLLRSKRIVEHLRCIRSVADQNRRMALSLVRKWHQALSKEKQRLFRNKYGRLAEDAFIFDNKSGAIAFDTYEWETKVKKIRAEPWKSAVEYFDEALGDKWQTDRPNLARRLETPTKTILRGEEYYANLANIPPLERLEGLASHFFKFFNRFSREQLETIFSEWHSLNEWKLALATCDQLRNQVLQINWFVYKLGCHEEARQQCRVNELGLMVRDLTEAAVGLYYSILLLRSDCTAQHLAALASNHPKLHQLLRRAVKVLRKTGKIEEDMTFTKEFIRRWREADHPGENLLTAAQAIQFCIKNKIRAPQAIGISWGGIELPLVFQQVWILTQGGNIPKVLAADYSHYRKHGELEELDYIPLASNSPTAPDPERPVLLFDDNILTGKTIERVYDDLTLRGCKISAVFVTRISGVRRYGQMRMPGHGVLTPDAVGKLVFGILGETPFALTWSREKYENPMGVFSLARRRVLELLHANSSVERYDREGF